MRIAIGLNKRYINNLHTSARIRQSGHAHELSNHTRHRTTPRATTKLVSTCRATQPIVRKHFSIQNTGPVFSPSHILTFDDENTRRQINGVLLYTTDVLPIVGRFRIQSQKTLPHVLARIYRLAVARAFYDK